MRCVSRPRSFIEGKEEMRRPAHIGFNFTGDSGVSATDHYDVRVPTLKTVRIGDFNRHPRIAFDLKQIIAGFNPKACPQAA
jgi:hypothetical protein